MSGRPTVVLVLGMHRSGTSLAAECLKAAGLHVADEFVAPDTLINRRGFWEDRRVVEIDEALFTALGSAWYDARELPPAWTQVKEVQSQMEIARRHVTSQYANAGVSMIKDPRLCRLLPFWLPVLADCGVDLRLLLVVRSPGAVAASLQVRNGLPPDYAFLLYYRYLSEALTHSRSYPVAVLDYDDLLNTPAASLRRVLTELDLNTGFEEAAVDEIADASLRHHDGHAVDCESARAATGLYAMIRGGLPNAPIPVTELPRGDVDDLTFRMAAALLDHRAEQVRVGTLHATALEVIARRDSQLAEVQANEARLGELYTQAEAVIHEREAQLRALQARLEETSALYNHAEQVVHAQTARLTEMEGVLDRLRNSLLGRLALSRAIRPAGGGSEGTKEKIE